MENRGKILDAVLELVAEAPFDAICKFSLYLRQETKKGAERQARRTRERKKTVCTKRKKKLYSLTRKRFSLCYES